MNNPFYKIRQASSDDLSFIYSTFLKSNYYNNLNNKLIKSSIYYQNYREVIDRILLNSEILIACTLEEESVILGYIIYQEDLLHYIFIKQVFRQLGIGSELVKQANEGNKLLFTSHTSKDYLLFSNKLNLVLDYNPFSLYMKGI